MEQYKHTEEQVDTKDVTFYSLGRGSEVNILPGKLLGGEGSWQVQMAVPHSSTQWK